MYLFYIWDDKLEERQGFHYYYYIYMCVEDYPFDDPGCN